MCMSATLTILSERSVKKYNRLKLKLSNFIEASYDPGERLNLLTIFDVNKARLVHIRRIEN